MPPITTPRYLTRCAAQIERHARIRHSPLLAIAAALALLSAALVRLALERGETP